MGINANGLRFLLMAKEQGVDFSRVAMLGRQGIHIEYKIFCHIVQHEFQFDVKKDELEVIHRHFYAEKLFQLLGATEVSSFDFSDYEGASYVHDFNVPVGDKFRKHYSVVFDGGTLEHVFFFPIALQSAMDMVCKKGSFIGVSAANNEMGHGFYQLSPELYYRTLSPTNGFQIEEMFLHEGRESRKWFDVKDPEVIKKRVMLVNTKPTLLLVRACRIAEEVIFSDTPQQSDYSIAWKREASGPNSSALRGQTWQKLSRLVPVGIKRVITITLVWMRYCWLRLRILAGGGHDLSSLVPFDPANSGKALHFQRRINVNTGDQTKAKD